MPSPSPSLIVMVCCAQWCGVCREFKDPLADLAQSHPVHQFVWVDIENCQAWEDEFDIENFPTVLVCDQNGGRYFQGPIEPHIRALSMLLDSLARTPASGKLDSQTQSLVERVSARLSEQTRCQPGCIPNNFMDLS